MLVDRWSARAGVGSDWTVPVVASFPVVFLWRADQHLSAAMCDQGEEDDDEGPQQQRHHDPLGAGLGGHGAQVPAQAHLPPALRVLQAAAAPLHLGPQLLDSGHVDSLLPSFYSSPINQTRKHLIELTNIVVGL